MTRKVLMPAFAGDPVVETLFVEAGFVVDYALDAEARARSCCAETQGHSRCGDAPGAGD
jgi:hypothetical protein